MAQRPTPSRTAASPSARPARLGTPTERVVFAVPDAVIKGQAKRLLAELRRTTPTTTLSQAQAMLARVWNEKDWHGLQQRAQRAIKPEAPLLEPWSLERMNPRLLTLLLERWLPPAEGMWPARTTDLIQAVVPTLVAVMAGETTGHVTPQALLDRLSLDSIVDLAHRGTLPAESLAAVRGYLQRLPGIQAGHGQDWGTRPKNLLLPQAYDHHGYLLMLLGVPLQTLQQLLPLLDTVVWESSWDEVLNPGHPLFEMTLGTWLDRREAHCLCGSHLFGSGHRPAVRLRDLLQRMAETLSDHEVAILRHWLNRASHPAFVPTALAMKARLSAPAD